MSSCFKLHFSKGDSVNAKHHTITSCSDFAVIGQCPNSEIRLPNDSLYEDVEYAAFILNDDKTSWRIVRLDHSTDIFINEERLHLVHYLSKGDKIRIDGQESEMVFTPISEDKVLDAKHLADRLKWYIITPLSLLVVMVIALLLWIIPSQEINDDDINQHKGSIYKISTVSVMYQEVDIRGGKKAVTTIDSLVLNNRPTGTAFLTSDGKFITARHCVEPWLSVFNPLEEIEDNSVSLWAAEAETFNILNEQDSIFRRVITINEIFANNTIIYTFSSDTCYYNCINDRIMNVRGVFDPLYWRDLGWINDKGALGDIIYLNTSLRGSIELANDELLNALEESSVFLHWGYESDAPQAHGSRSLLKYEISRGPNEEILKVMEHRDFELPHGFSGSPVFAKFDNKVYVVGIMSKSKIGYGTTCFSIPITQINQAEKRWGE